MPLTPEQIKGRIKSLANKNNVDARPVMRMYMMDRFLERLSLSQYRDNFIIKGGLLVTSMVGISMRSTMDIDASLSHYTLTIDNTLKILNEITNMDIGDGITFSVNKVSNIMSVMEYPGIRAEMDAIIENMITPFKLDISTGDVITPRAIEYPYKLMLEDRTINILAYNLETILAEKLQAILARNVYNTRMRDFYDIYTLVSLYHAKIDCSIFKNAFRSTCSKRKTADLLSNMNSNIETIASSPDLQLLWKEYQNKFNYAQAISFDSAITSIKTLAQLIKDRN